MGVSASRAALIPVSFENNPCLVQVCVPVSTESSSRAGPSQPQHLTIAVLSNSSLTAEWVEPADDGGDAAITYTITLQGGPSATTRTVSSLRTNFTGLEAPNSYTVTVAAENRAGTSPTAEETISFQGIT